MPAYALSSAPPGEAAAQMAAGGPSPAPYRSLDAYPALILNADWRPLSYFPLSVWPWYDAIKAIFRDSVTVVSEYDRVIRSPSTELKLPSVLVLKEFVHNKRRPAFTRFNVFLRDNWTCQYCNKRHATSALTFDHVMPRSRGGYTSWENIVTACQPCNLRKGSKMPHECNMFPAKKPYQPSIHELQNVGRKYPPRYLHESWQDYLYWDTELLANVYASDAKEKWPHIEIPGQQ